MHWCRVSPFLRPDRAPAHSRSRSSSTSSTPSPGLRSSHRHGDASHRDAAAPCNAPRRRVDLGPVHSSTADTPRLLLPIRLALAALLAVGLGSASAAASDATGEDCINSTCSGVTSCAKLKRACSYGGGTFVAKTRDKNGDTTSGTCQICY